MRKQQEPVSQTENIDVQPYSFDDSLAVGQNMSIICRSKSWGRDITLEVSSVRTGYRVEGNAFSMEEAITILIGISTQVTGNAPFID